MGWGGVGQGQVVGSQPKEMGKSWLEKLAWKGKCNSHARPEIQELEYEAESKWYKNIINFGDLKGPSILKMYNAVNEKKLMCVESSYVPSPMLHSLLHFLEQ